MPVNLTRIFGLDRRLIIIAVAVFGMIGYIYLTPPESQLSLAARLEIDTGLDADLEMYIQRFALSFILFGAVPILAARLCGYKLRDIGFKKPECRHAWIWMIVAIAAGVVIGLGGSLSSTLAEYYPYDTGLADKVAKNGAWPFFTHAGAYITFYYLPWELLFRGVLIFPLLEESIDNVAVSGKTILFAGMQTIPSTLLHSGHPIEEIAGAALLGFIAAWLTIRTRSIIPILLLHSASGVFLDLSFVLQYG